MTPSAYAPAPRFLALGDGFADVVRPAAFPEHRLRFRNDRWAARVGLGELDNVAWIDHFARFRPLTENLPEPLALRYHGHQFGVYNPRLGDGRGFLYAQLRDPVDGRLLDLGTKGSGRTPWSRDGDGRLTLKGGVREVLATEMLEALGVPTSKSFSLVETGESLERGDEPSPTRASVLVRLSHSHVRFGSFQRLAYESDASRLRRLVDFTVEHYYPDLCPAKNEGMVGALFRAISRRSARLAASFMAAGFVHGVLNTDNMNVTGEAFDYGPYRFLPRYEPMFVAAYFDTAARYAFCLQPEVVRWNLERLADALSPLVPAAELLRALVDYEPRVMRLHHLRFLARLGLRPRDAVSDSLLVSRCLCFLEQGRVGFDRFFYDWYGGAASERRALDGPEGSRYAGERWRAAFGEIQASAPASPERLGDAYFQAGAPCSMCIDDVEAVWRAIDASDDWSPFERKIAEVRAMGEATGLAARAGDEEEA